MGTGKNYEGPGITEETVGIKETIEKDFEKNSKLSVEEYTLYRKWEEVNHRDWTTKQLQRMHEIEKSIWMPESPEDYLNLEPAVVQAEDQNTNLTWTILRVFTSSMHWNPNPGRLMRFFAQDKKTKGYLGVISVGSDFISVGGRDEYIGWTSDNRLKDKMLNHTAMGSSIVPTQPLGYNYTGGKLMALLTACNTIEKAWNERYKQRLVGITTTSLFGGLSQYNRLKYWRKCKSSEGQIPLEPSQECYEKIKEYMKKVYPDKIRELQSKSHPKNTILSFIYKELNIKPPVNNFPRGVYFCELYKNTREFLRREEIELGPKKFDNSIGFLSELWKERYAKKRLESLLKKRKFNTNSLFYSKIIGKEWEDVREKYLDEVGKTGKKLF